MTEVYRLTYRNHGYWDDIEEEGETFDFDTEKEAIHLLETVGWKNGRGERMSYRKVTEKELEEEARHWANIQANMM